MFLGVLSLVQNSAYVSNRFYVRAHRYKHRKRRLTVYVQLCHLVSVTGTLVVGKTHHPFSSPTTLPVAVVAQPAI